MRKFTMITSLLLCFYFNHGQEPQTNVHEEVYLHLNQTDLTSGETLLFSAYVRSATTKKLSALSSILYVELLDNKSVPIYQTKIKLSGGRGQGEYFISSLLSTGNYHLVAYTRWMKNFNQYFRTPLTVINPFESYQKKDTISAPLLLKFFPEGGSLLEGADNLVGLTSRSSTGRYLEEKGRIVGSDGEKVADFKTDEFGIGSFSFTPVEGVTYQAITENSRGEFIFHNLPPNCSDCQQLRLKKQNGILEVSVNGMPGDGYLTMRNCLYEFSKQEMVFPNTVRLNLKNFPEGVLQVILTNSSGEPIAKRLIMNGNIPNAITPSISRHKKREKVDVSFEAYQNASLSVSVQRLHAGSTAIGLANTFILESSLTEAPRAMNYDEQNIENLLLISELREIQIADKNPISYAPELRYDFVQGVVTDKSTPVGDKLIALALPGKGFRVQLTKTSPEGEFLIGFPPPLEESQIFLNVIDSVNYEVKLENEFYSSYPEFVNIPITFDSSRVAQIVARSINSQIENAYYVNELDTTLSLEKLIDQFEGNRYYVLDEFVRFPTLKETFREYIPEVGVGKGETNYRVNLRLQYRTQSDAQFESLILIDGYPVSSKEMFEVSPYAVRSIRVINDTFYFGDIRLSGIISIKTFKEDYKGPNSETDVADYIGLQPKKIYKFPEYEADSKLPDQRAQLFWNPEILVENGKLEFDFYTSDVPGIYEITVEGIAKDGNPISLRKRILVE